MALLDDDVRAALESKFARDLDGPVRILSFTRPTTDPEQAEANQQARSFLDEVAALHPSLSVEHLDHRHKLADTYGLDRYPSIVLEGAQQGLVRFLGVPWGDSFSPFVQDLVYVSRGSTGLDPDTVEELTALEVPVHIQVFVTPDSPHCPPVVALVHQMAVVSEQVTADVVDVTVFPDMVKRYGIRSVPKIWINESLSFEGAMGEDQLLDYVLAAVDEEN